MSDETLNPAGSTPSGDPVTKPPAGGDLSDTEQTDKDMAYSPSSGRETEALQESQALNDTDIDAGNVNLLPGTGGPDDVGDIEVDPDEIDLEGNAGIS